MNEAAAIDLLISLRNNLVKTSAKLEDENLSIEAEKVRMRAQDLVLLIERLQMERLESWCSPELLSELRNIGTQVVKKIHAVEKSNKRMENVMRGLELVEQLISKLSHGRI